VNLFYGPAAQFVVGSSLSYRPNLVGEPLAPSGQRGVDNYLNSSAVTIPTDRSQPFGSAGRNIVVGPSLFTADLGLHKSFAVFGEGKRLEFRAEAFNVLNHTNFRQPNGNRSSIAYGTIRSAFPARQMQFALKFLY